jgi:hypothetical protein
MPLVVGFTQFHDLRHLFIAVVMVNSLLTNAAMENISVADATTANILLTEHGVKILIVTMAIF